jgi:hypothetical protein
MKKATELGSRFKTMILKHTESAADRVEAERPPPPPPPPVFFPTSSAANPASRASQDLQRFKAFLENPLADGKKYFPGVNDTFSAGLTYLRCRASDHESQLEEAQAAAGDFDTQESENRALEHDHRASLAALEREASSLRATVADMRARNDQLSTQIAAGKAQKKLFRRSLGTVNANTLRLAELQEEFARESATTFALQNTLADFKVHAEAQQHQLALALESCEARVRELALQARNSQIEVQAAKEAKRSAKKKFEPLLLTPDVSAFVIDDKVRISIEDTETLQFMITELDKENELLVEWRNDIMSDIDCLMQENLGLKQIIRQLSEG